MGAMDRLGELGLTLPPAPAPAATYHPWSRSGQLVFTAGQIPVVDGELPRTGKLGSDLTTEQGAELARIAGLNVLAVVYAAVGDLDAVRTVKLTVFVAAVPEFTEPHFVANGASELLGAVLGDAGVHARSAVCVPALPRDAPVEVEAVFEVL